MEVQWWLWCLNICGWAPILILFGWPSSRKPNKSSNAEYFIHPPYFYSWWSQLRIPNSLCTMSLNENFSPLMMNHWISGYPQIMVITSQHFFGFRFVIGLPPVIIYFWVGFSLTKTNQLLDTPMAMEISIFLLVVSMVRPPGSRWSRPGFTASV